MSRCFATTSPSTPCSSRTYFMHAVTVRAIRPQDWRQVRALRLEALQDEAAAVAFSSNYAESSALPDEFWQDRAFDASEAAGATARSRQFVAIAADGSWVGSVSVLAPFDVDDTGSGLDLATRSPNLVGVYIRPLHRGSGLLAKLVEAAAAWVQELGFSLLCLGVNVDNPRALRAYEKLGFVKVSDLASTPSGCELEMRMAIDDTLTTDGTRTE